MASRIGQPVRQASAMTHERGYASPQTVNRYKLFEQKALFPFTQIVILANLSFQAVSIALDFTIKLNSHEVCILCKLVCRNTHRIYCIVTGKFFSALPDQANRSCMTKSLLSLFYLQNICHHQQLKSHMKYLIQKVSTWWLSSFTCRFKFTRKCESAIPIWQCLAHAITVHQFQEPTTVS